MVLYVYGQRRIKKFSTLGKQNSEPYMKGKECDIEGLLFLD